VPEKQSKRTTTFVSELQHNNRIGAALRWEKKLEPHFYYTDKIQYQIQCKTNYKIHNFTSSVSENKSK
jgi:hypothetical protein